jgi:hypothetical protein
LNTHHQSRYPPEKYCRDAAAGEAAEHAKVEENAVCVNQGSRAGTGMVHGRTQQVIKKTAELLQQFNGPPRFGKHSLIYVQSNRETSETQENLFSEQRNRRYT